MKVICTLPPGGDITVHAGERTRTIVRDDVIDLDDVLVPARTDPRDPSRELPPHTLFEALGGHLEDGGHLNHFDPYVEPQGAPQAAPDAAAADQDQE